MTWIEVGINDLVSKLVIAACTAPVLTVLVPLGDGVSNGEDG